MFCNFAAGAAYGSFISLLIPAYITETTGSAAEAGVIMAVIGLGALIGPVLGSLADRYHAHRLILILGTLGLSIGFIAYALSSATRGVYVLEALILGVGLAAIAVIGAVYIVGAGLPKAAEAKQLTTFNLLYPIGQLAGGVVMGWAATQKWSYSDRFWLSSAAMAIATVLVIFTTRAPSARLDSQQAKEDASIANGRGSAEQSSPRLGTVLLSTFGLFLFIVILSSITNNGINSQISNIMPNVFGYSSAQTATLVAVAGGINILATLGAGTLMSKSNPMTVYVLGQGLRAVGATGMALLGSFASGSQLLAGLFMQILYQGSPVGRLPQAPIGTRLAIVKPGSANGFVVAGAAVGAFLGSLIGGFVAKEIGFNAVNWMGALSGVVAFLLIFFFLVPAWRKGPGSEILADTESAVSN